LRLVNCFCFGGVLSFLSKRFTFALLFGKARSEFGQQVLYLKKLELQKICQLFGFQRRILKPVEISQTFLT